MTDGANPPPGAKPKATKPKAPANPVGAAKPKAAAKPVAAAKPKARANWKPAANLKPGSARTAATSRPGASAKTAAKPSPARKAAAASASAKPKRAVSASAKPKPAAPTALTVLFIRHADAGDPATWTGTDAERPLSKKGRRQAKRLGDLLDRLRVRPEALLTSPRVRAADTAKLIGRRIGRSSKVEPRLDAGFNAEALGSLIAELDATSSTVAIVGHDPDFSTLASWLVDAPLALSKGALARVDLPERAVGPGKGTLQWLLPPDAVSS